VKPYRVEWRANLLARWLLMSEHDRHEDAQAAATAAVTEMQGQARIVSQHVIEIRGLQAGKR